MRYIILAVVCLAAVMIMTGCSSVKTDTTPVLPEQPTYQQDLLEPCEVLPKLEEKDYTQAESFDIIKQWIRAYYDCSNKQAALAELLKNEESHK